MHHKCVLHYNQNECYSKNNSLIHHMSLRASLMCVQFGAAFGCEVTVISTSPQKEEDARALGAKHFIVSSDPEAMKAAAGTLDGIIDTVSAKHDIGALLGLLGIEGTLVLVGASPEPLPVHAFSLLMGNKKIAGSIIGGIPPTQEMLDFCGEKDIVAQIELIPVTYVNEAYERLMKNDVKGRFVLDMSTLKASE